MTEQRVVKLTANFERNLESIERFLDEAEALQAFDALLDLLTDTAIPNLERFPNMGPLLTHRRPYSVEVSNAQETLCKKLQTITNGNELREYLLNDYLILYTLCEEIIYLLSIKHHKQLSFDFSS